MKTNMARRANFILQGSEPVIWQTPGRLQYFRAENEPFLPGKSKLNLNFCLDEVKWGLRLPSRFAVRQLSLNYEEDV